MPKSLVILATVVLLIAMFEAPNKKLEDSMNTMRSELEQLQRELDNTPQRLIRDIPHEVREIGKIPAFKEFDKYTLTSGAIMFW